jgi:hypothetical protein
MLIHRKNFHFWSVDVGFHKLRCWYSTPSQIPTLSCPKNFVTEILPSCFSQKAEVHVNYHNSRYAYANMIKSGGHDLHDFLTYIDIQHMADS